PWVAAALRRGRPGRSRATLRPPGRWLRPVPVPALLTAPSAFLLRGGLFVRFTRDRRCRPGSGDRSSRGEATGLAAHLLPPLRVLHQPALRPASAAEVEQR